MENIVPNPAAGFTVPVPDLAAMFGGFPQRTITRTFNEVCRAEEAILIQALIDHGAQKGAARTKAAEEALIAANYPPRTIPPEMTSQDKETYYALAAIPFAETKS